MMALLLAAFAVYLWKSFDKGFLYGIIPICLSLGFYQSYVSVAITLILLYLIMQLLNGYSADGKYRSFVQIMFFPFSHIYYMVLNALVFALQILMISSSTASVYLPSAISRFRISLRAFIIISVKCYVIFRFFHQSNLLAPISAIVQIKRKRET